MSALIKIYDFFSRRRAWLWGLLTVFVGVQLAWALRIRYHEDIFDFLPGDTEYAESMRIYSSLNEASRIVVIFEGNDPDSIGQAIDAMGECREDIITEPDLDGFLARLDFVYANMPYFLSAADYDTLETRLADIDRWLAVDKQILAMPGTSFLRPVIASDPLRLIPISKGATGQYAGAQTAFTAYNGYMMTADRRLGFAFCDSPYGSTESGRNGPLIDSLQMVADSLMVDYPSVNIRLLGAPVIAVGNARCIKHDSLVAILLSLVWIIALLLYAFPRRRDMLLIVAAVAFGWLSGMAALALSGMQVSIIVLGIGAILIGIAVNYPLHILVHQRYTCSVRQTLQEVLTPLVVGNITTIGAFLALLPLSSPALRQLGIFAAAMFVGTILFCVLFLPHLMSASPTPVREIRWPAAERAINRIATPRVRNYCSLGVVALLLVLSVFVWKNEKPFFDANISHINYMTPEQRADFAYFESLSPVSDEPAYLARSAREELTRRVECWNTFWMHHDADSVSEILREAAIRNGYQPDAFAPFMAAIHTTHYDTASITQFSSEELAQRWPGRFDTESLNRYIATSLSDNFDYLGMVCSLIVLVFLCLSFRSIILGLIAFLPMLLSWILIFSLMAVFDLQFNMVNVILATFIFGQGDDYTIFVLEGLVYEYRTGKKILPQYKQSIILSALIMLLAIGVLIFASHPAMYSLGAVTLIGMTCVVAMAFIIPPICMRLIVYVRSLISSDSD